MTRTQMTGIGLAGALLVAAAATQAQTRGGTPQPVADAARSAWDGAKKNIRGSAEFMPEAKFTFKPVRYACGRSANSSATWPARTTYSARQPKGRSHRRPKPRLNRSRPRPRSSRRGMSRSRYCNGVFAALTDRSAAESIDMPFEQGKGARLSASDWQRRPPQRALRQPRHLPAHERDCAAQFQDGRDRKCVSICVSIDLSIYLRGHERDMPPCFFRGDASIE